MVYRSGWKESASFSMESISLWSLSLFLCHSWSEASLSSTSWIVFCKMTEWWDLFMKTDSSMGMYGALRCPASFVWPRADCYHPLVSFRGPQIVRLCSLHVPSLRKFACCRDHKHHRWRLTSSRFYPRLLEMVTIAFWSVSKAHTSARWLFWCSRLDSRCLWMA